MSNYLKLYQWIYRWNGKYFLRFPFIGYTETKNKVEILRIEKEITCNHEQENDEIESCELNDKNLSKVDVKYVNGSTEVIFLQKNSIVICSKDGYIKTDVEDYMLEEVGIEFKYVSKDVNVVIDYTKNDLIVNKDIEKYLNE